MVGVGIFGTLTGYLANLFLAPRARPSVEPTADNARRRLEELHELVARQQAALAEFDVALRPPG